MIGIFEIKADKNNWLLSVGYKASKTVIRDTVEAIGVTEIIHDDDLAQMNPEEWITIESVKVVQKKGAVMNIETIDIKDLIANEIMDELFLEIRSKELGVV